MKARVTLHRTDRSRLVSSMMGVLLLFAACGGNSGPAITTHQAPPLDPTGATALPTTSAPTVTLAPTTTTIGEDTTTSVAATVPPTDPTFEITPTSGPSGTQFMARVAGCVLTDRPSVPVVEGQISVEWLDAPSLVAAGPEAHNVEVRAGAFAEELDSAAWPHWVSGADGSAFYNGLGANPGTYRVTVSCGDVEYDDGFFTILDLPPVYLVNTFDFIPGVLVAPGDNSRRDLFTAPRGSGCVVYGTILPDGVWFGFIREFTPAELAFDLGCFFTEEAALAAAAADGGSTARIPVLFGDLSSDQHAVTRPTVYVRNRNPLIFTVPVDAEARVWHLATVSGTAVDHIDNSIATWPAETSPLTCPGPSCGVWLYVNDGQVTAIVEQYLPVWQDAAEAVAGHIAAEWPPWWSWGKDRTWECEVMTVGPLAAGSVVQCGAPPQDPQDDSQYPVVTVLVLDDAGTLAVAQAGVYRPLNVWDMEQSVGPGRSCGELAAEDSFLVRFIDEPDLRYFGTVLYWFVEGKPDRLDPRGNGRPCEDGYVPAVIDAVWSGGWIGESP